MLLDHHQSPVKTLSSVTHSTGGTMAETSESTRVVSVASRQPSTALMIASPHASGRSVPATVSMTAHQGVPMPDAAAPTTSAAYGTLESPSGPPRQSTGRQSAKSAASAAAGGGASRRASAAAATAQANAAASDDHSNTKVAAPSFVPSTATPCANGLGTV